MEIARCPDPLYTTPKPCYTADFNHYLTLHRSVLSSEQDYHLEVESVLVYVESGRGGVTINGLIFSIETGCACLLQTYHTYRFSSVKDDVLHLRVLVLDYPLLASIGYRVPDPQRIGAAMEQMPVVHCSPSTQSEMLHIFHKFEQVQEQASTHTILIKVALCGQLKLLYAQEALRAKPLPFPAPAGWKRLAVHHQVLYQKSYRRRRSCGGRCDCAAAQPGAAVDLRVQFSSAAYPSQSGHRRFCPSSQRPFHPIYLPNHRFSLGKYHVPRLSGMARYDASGAAGKDALSGKSLPPIHDL